MYHKQWYRLRGSRFIGKRLANILRRYRLSPTLAIARIDSCVDALIGQDCRPTFPTPGLIVERYPNYFRGLQDKGVEIAVHGYQHKDLGILSLPKAHKQLVRAVSVFRRNGLEAHGFRCPYLGYSDELLDSIPKGLFKYSSNKSVLWDVGPIDADKIRASFVLTLRSLYKPGSSSEIISIPWSRPNVLEIPISMPDDMTLVDGYGFDTQRVAQAWIEILEKTYRRGEIFNLIFHPELMDRCQPAFMDLLGQAKRKNPRVWIARLCDISGWWREKAGFKTEIVPLSAGIRLVFKCTQRATILAKGLALNGLKSEWDGNYIRLKAETLDIPSFPRPFVGLSSDVHEKTSRFLREQGYILDEGQTAPSCGIYLDSTRLSMLANETQLIDFIDSCGGPLVRFGRWPDGAKSALAVTGDLDALSLADYFSRLHI
jgi:hypothetical protein